MKILDIAKKYGCATHTYPFEPYKVSEGFRGKPSYNYDKCIGCAACSIACPPNAISVKKNSGETKLVWEINYGRCIFCGRCDEVCPTNAIMLSDEFELAVKFDKNALKVTAELDLEYCEVCKNPFTTKKLISYTLERLKQTNLREMKFEQNTPSIKICQKCKSSKVVEQTNRCLAGGFK